MKSIAGRVALVTGAASGIGRATALEMARQGARLILVDVNEDELSSVRAEVNVHSQCLLSRVADVSQREQMAALAEAVDEVTSGPDILVNSAGVYLTGGILDLSLEDWDWVLSVNLWGTIHACHYFVPRMVERHEGGHVVNVASMYGYWPSPEVAGYLTSKFGVFGFSEALREDLRPHGVDVSTVCPGIIQTGLIRRMRIRNQRDGEALRRHLDRTYRRRSYTPDRVARAIVKAIRRRKKVVLVTPESRLMYRVERLCPPLSRWIARIAAKRLFVVPRTSPQSESSPRDSANGTLKMDLAERSDA
ncbi:MAG: SDR family NAD(P)-dependent oxidoreductase [Phycisphaerae bacterium]|nr:SDR family NAD(P)-dependent oxidoreductase [Phycisphaerae bacterium]